MERASAASRMRRLLLLLALFATVLVAVPAPGVVAAAVALDPAEAGITAGGPHVDAMAPSRSAGRLAKDATEAAPARLQPAIPAAAAAPWPRPAGFVRLDDFLFSAPRWAHRGAIGDRAPPSRRVDL